MPRTLSLAVDDSDRNYSEQTSNPARLAGTGRLDAELKVMAHLWKARAHRKNEIYVKLRNTMAQSA